MFFLKSRFRNKTARLLAVVRQFRESESIALHPDQVSRRLGISLQEAHRMLDTTPELFVRLPRGPDRVTKYALTPSFSSLQPDEGKAFIARQARKESLGFWTVMLIYTIAGLALLIAVLGTFGIWRHAG